jgi:ribosomal-protein-alanine N-acetyltransferase
MPSRFLVRAARRDDAPALGAIAIDAWAASAFAELDAGRTDREALRRTFTDFCQTHHARILVAEGQDGLLGWGARENGDFHISDLWVGPSAQGQGVGTALLEALEVGIAKAAYNFVELETYAGNVGALRFYQRHGYQIIWRGLKFSASLNYELDKVRLARSLDRGTPPDTGLPEA